MDSIIDHLYPIILQADAAANATKPVASKEGRAVAYSSLIVMSAVSIVLGAFRSVKQREVQRKNLKETGGQADVISTKDAMMFPIIASCALGGLYIVFKLFSKEYVNLLLTGYFVLLGSGAFFNLLKPILDIFHATNTFHLTFNQYNDKEDTTLCDFKFNVFHVSAALISTGVGIWYLAQKHWIANNIFGIAFAITGIEFISLNKVYNGCVLLAGLFFYDIFWVFATDVMVTVARSFEAPIKLVFPQDFLELGLLGTNHAMLGLGDIVIPGIFIALLLRFDGSSQKNSKTYFYFSFMAYILGLIVTIIVMVLFNHAQPALLYLVPACLGIPLSVAYLKGDFKDMFEYKDYEESKTNDKSE